MNKYLKKFAIVSAMLSTIVGSVVIQNGITANAATFGQRLTQPETGWKRYDDTDKSIQYTKSVFFASGYQLFYNSTYHYNHEAEYSIKFSFYGSKLRLLGNPVYSANLKISFDGGNTFEKFSTYSNNPLALPQSLVYEKTGLEKKVHDVIIANGSTTYNVNTRFQLDAIDIDSDGELIPYGQSESISLNKSSLDLIEGNSEQLTATTTPSVVGAIWKSSDESVATVDSTGKVTALKEGQATITASISDSSNLSATCTVNVTAPKLVSLSVTPEKKIVTPGTQQQLQVTATMSDESTKDVTDGSNGTTYSSSRPNIGTVDENGFVTIFQDAPLGYGTTIYVTYGGITVSSEISTGTDTTN